MGDIMYKIKKANVKRKSLNIWDSMLCKDVSSIIDKVRKEGDKALYNLTEKI